MYNSTLFAKISLTFLSPSVPHITFCLILRSISSLDQSYLNNSVPALEPHIGGVTIGREVFHDLVHTLILEAISNCNTTNMHILTLIT